MSLKKNLLPLFFILFVFCFTTVQGQVKDEEYIFGYYEKNYDSLLSQMMNTKRINARQKGQVQISSTYYTTSAENIPDSVFIKRLKTIPTIIPLTYNAKVRGFIEMYINRYKRTTNMMLALSEYYFPIFEKILDEVGVPDELKNLAIIESALNPVAVSRAGACGLWQFMYGTGKVYGLEINSLVDERRDPIKSTYAAATYLRDLYKIYGDWNLAIASYNCGPGNVNKAIRRANVNGKAGFWEIYNYLPAETRGYVPAFIAATYIMNYYKAHGISTASVEPPVVTDTVGIIDNIHFDQLSNVLGIEIEQLRVLNPQYKSDVIPGKGNNSYYLKLPQIYISKFITFEDSVYKYNRDNYFRPTETGSFASTSGKNLEIAYHTVKKGENWARIATKYGVSVSELKGWNKKKAKSKNLAVGTRLIVYKNNPLAVKTTTKASNDGDNKAATTAASQKVYHTVRKGDTFSEIADKYNTTTKNLYNLNNLNKNYVLKIGQKIRVK